MGLDFGLALRLLLQGTYVCRSGWNGKNMYIALQTPDENSKMTLPYIYMKTATGGLVPWLASQTGLASQTDILSSDWEIYSA